MKTFPLAAATLLFLSSLGLCRANIGETEAQCIARYGAESEVQTDVGYRQVGDKAASFTKTTPTASISIRVTFLNGTSCHEVIGNTDASAGLSEEQLKALLDSQAAGFKWHKKDASTRTVGQSITYETVTWQRTDGATATFWLSGKANTENRTGQMDIATKQYTVQQAFYDKENGN